MPAPLDLAYGRAPILRSFLAWSATHSWRSLGRFRVARTIEGHHLALLWMWNEQASPGAPPKRAQSVRRRRGRSF